MKLKRLYRAITHPSDLIIYLLQKAGVIARLDDETYVRLIYFIQFHKRLNLKNPQTFSEKLQWLKLYNRKPEYTKMVDKYAVKDYVTSIIGSEYVIPTLGVWDRPEDIEWDKLPNQFVLKTTHGGGNEGVVICRDKNTFDRNIAVVKLNKSLKQDIYRELREWPYKDVPKRIIAEQFISPAPDENDLPDYKFFCFDGEVKALFIGTERGSGDVKFDYFDADFNHLDLIQYHPMSGKKFSKPKNFDEMKQVASKLSKGIPQVRIDLYNVNGKIYFGEMTFYHHGGMMPFHPKKWDMIFGDWIKINCNQ
jgi:hypothetical protein